MPDDPIFPDPDIDPATWDALIALLTAAYGAGMDDSAELVGMGKASAVEYAQARGADLLGKRLVAGEWVDNPVDKWVVSDTIRDQVRAKLVKAIEEGQSPGEFRAALEQELSDIDYRALMVARTETGFAYNAGALANYKDAEVTHVMVMDGGTDGSCDDCNEIGASDEPWTIEEAEANPLEHPNCTRAFSPVLMEE
jgi:hypothetical protein